jgi:Fe-S-cluster containining protein
VKGCEVLFDCSVTDFTDKGKCSNCGQCCSNCLPLSDYEVKRIKAYIKKHKIKEQRHNAMVGTDMTCPFRDEANKKCLIYEIRPAICRQFMCNHTKEDILNWKIDFHKKFNVVFMRKEFFDNSEDIDVFTSILQNIRGAIYC